MLDSERSPNAVTVLLICSSPQSHRPCTTRYGQAIPAVVTSQRRVMISHQHLHTRQSHAPWISRRRGSNSDKGRQQQRSLRTLKCRCCCVVYERTTKKFYGVPSLSSVPPKSGPLLFRDVGRTHFLHHLEKPHFQSLGRPWPAYVLGCVRMPHYYYHISRRTLPHPTTLHRGPCLQRLTPCPGSWKFEERGGRSGDQTVCHCKPMSETANRPKLRIGAVR